MGTSTDKRKGIVNLKNISDDGGNCKTNTLNSSSKTIVSGSLYFLYKSNFAA